MAILNYTTKVSAAQSVAEIHKILALAGAMRVVDDFDENGEIKSVGFQIKIRENIISYLLPCNWQKVQAVLKKDFPRQKAIWENGRARRVAWRIVKDWVEAQIALINAENATLDQIFLPYALALDGETLYEKISARDYKLLRNGGENEHAN